MTSTPPRSSARRAVGTRCPTGAKTMAASSGSGGASSALPTEAGAQCEGELPCAFGSGEHMDRCTLPHRDLRDEVGGGTEAVEAQASAGREGRASERPVADDARAEQRRDGGRREPLGDAGTDEGDRPDEVRQDQRPVPSSGRWGCHKMVQRPRRGRRPRSSDVHRVGRRRRIRHRDARRRTLRLPRTGTDSPDRSGTTGRPRRSRAARPRPPGHRRPVARTRGRRRPRVRRPRGREQCAAAVARGRPPQGAGPCGTPRTPRPQPGPLGGRAPDPRPRPTAAVRPQSALAPPPPMPA
jgi:hypothetical protein